jgi:hypothetical protein
MVAGDTRGTVEFGAQWEGDKGGTSTQPTELKSGPGMDGWDGGFRFPPAWMCVSGWGFEEWDPGALDHEGGKGQPM